MSEKKNIDRLFQEKFKDFDVAPPEGVWQNIEAELKKEEKERRFIPLWFRLTGVAAVLLIGLMLTMPLFKGVDTGNNPVVIDNTDAQGQGTGKNISPVDKPLRPTQTVTEVGNETIIVKAGDAVAEGTTESKTGSSKTGPGTNEEKAGDGLSTSKPSNRLNPGYRATDDNTIAYEKQPQGTSVKAGRANKNNSIKHAGASQTGIATNTPGARNNKGQGSNKSTKINNKTNTIGNITTQQEAVAANNRLNSNNQTTTNNNKSVDTGNPTAVQPESNTAVASTPGERKQGNTTIINEESVNNAVAEAAVDTTSVKPENELEKLLQEKLKGTKDKEEEAIAEADINKWNIKPQLAPVFYNSLSEGSPIDPQFSGNSKDYNNDLSYGVGVNYALNSKISIRTGVNTVNLSYTTNDIQFYAALNQQTPNIAARGTVANIVVQNGDTNSSIGFVDDQLPTQKFNGSLVQKMGYIEVPLEMSYKVLDSRFGIDLIGGVSTLSLNENNVSVRSSQGYMSEVGEAQNLNNVHFSTNIGVGFKYRFWKAFEANFEPMFKYQVNTFSNNAGNFKPYFIGLYSGISFSF